MSKIQVTYQRYIDTINWVTDNNLHLLCGKNKTDRITYLKDQILNNINSLRVANKCISNDSFVKKMI